MSHRFDHLKRPARIAGAALGLMALAATLVLVRPVREAPKLGASLRLDVDRTDVVGVTTGASGTALRGDGLVRGGPAADGLVWLRNEGPDPVLVRFGLEDRSLGSAGRIAQPLRIRLSAQGQTLVEAPIAELATAPSRPFVLERRETATLALRAWIPEGADTSYAGAQTRVALTPETTSIGGRR